MDNHQKLTPLRRVRLKRQQTLSVVATAVDFDAGNLSRIERGKQVATVELAERLASYFEGEITELEILYPERYVPSGDKAA